MFQGPGSYDHLLDLARRIAYFSSVFSNHLVTVIAPPQTNFRQQAMVLIHVTSSEKSCNPYLLEKGLTDQLRVTLDFLLECALGLLKLTQAGCDYCKENVTNSEETKNDKKSQGVEMTFEER